MSQGPDFDTRLVPPRVSPSEYDRDYFLNRCAGAERWRLSEGRERAGFYDGCLEVAGMHPGQAVLDIGTGRGELLVAAIERGACSAVGVEYSAAAVALANETLRRCGVTDRARVVHADARSLPLPDDAFDLVTLLDVVEHLTREELGAALSEARRVLRPGARIFIHTFPTRTLYEVTYRLQRLARAQRRREWPVDPRNELERRMHVGEQSVWSLTRALKRAHFINVRVWPGRWIYTDFVLDPAARRLYHRLARVPGLRRLVIADLWASAEAPPP